jgi:hypothetical protein
MWIKDIEVFESAWAAQQEGREVKQTSNRRSQLLAQTKQGKKRSRKVKSEEEE